MGREGDGMVRKVAVRHSRCVKIRPLARGVVEIQEVGSVNQVGKRALLRSKIDGAPKSSTPILARRFSWRSWFMVNYANLSGPFRSQRRYVVWFYRSCHRPWFWTCNPVDDGPAMES